MFSLQFQIRNLTPVPFNRSRTDNHNKIAIRFGPLQADMTLQEGSAGVGKRLILEMENEEMRELLAKYAFGVFMQNEHGRYWCVLSLEKMKIGDQMDSNGLRMFDDYRKVCYQFGVTIKLEYHEPRVPQNLHATQPELRPPKVFQNSNNRKNETPAAPKSKISSFLYGQNKAASRDNPSALQKQSVPAPPRKNMDKKVKYGLADTQPILKPAYNNYIEDDQSTKNPPVMEFTNHEQPAYSMPVFDGHSAEPSTINVQTSKQIPKYKTFTNFDEFKSKTATSFNKNDKKQEQLKRREELRQLARKEAEEAFKNKKDTEIMIPIPNEATNTYTLVPISELSEAQIIDYAHKQQMAAQYKRHLQMERKLQAEKEQKKKKKKERLLEIKQNELRNMKKGLEKQTMGVTKKPANKVNRISEEDIQDSESDSFYNIQDSTEKKPKDNENYDELVEEKEPPYDSEADPLEDNAGDSDYYGDDFESVSNAGSLMQSRISARESAAKKKEEKELNESLDQYGYSQEFDSFSQSRMSRKKRANSISQISDSMASVSYRR